MRNITKPLTLQNPKALDPMLKVALALVVVSVFSALAGLLYASGTLDALPNLFLLPWILALTIIVGIPIIVAARSGKGLDSPLTFFSATFFIPAFSLGGLSLAVGWSQPYFLDFIQDFRTTLPYTVMIIILGYAGFALGFLLPVGKRVGATVGRFLPQRERPLSAYLVPGAILLCLGMLFYLYGVFIGLLGYNVSGEVGIFDATIYFLTLFAEEGSFILWWCIFRENRFSSRSLVILGGLISTAVVKGLFAGNRGTLLTMGIIVLAAFVLSGRKLTAKGAALGSVALSAAIIAGMIYGTTFRDMKGTEERASIDQYTSNIGETLERIGTQDAAANIEVGLMTLAQRLDVLSSLAVVVSNYEKLAPYEESYGLDNNIYRDTVSFVVPRVLWPEKPVASNPRAYSALYFDYGDNSFAITPMGDLLRNFGVSGVFLGMLVLGIALRVIYRVLVEGKRPNLLHSTMYIMLLMPVSFESFYGTILPTAFRSGAIALLGLIIVELLAANLPRRSGADHRRSEGVATA